MVRVGLAEQVKCYFASGALPTFQPLCRSAHTALERDREWFQEECIQVLTELSPIQRPFATIGLN